MRVKKFVNFREMGKSKKTIAAAAATFASKGGKKQASHIDPYAKEIQILGESSMKEEMLIKLHEDGLLLEKRLAEWKAPGNIVFLNWKRAK